MLRRSAPGIALSGVLLLAIVAAVGGVALGARPAGAQAPAAEGVVTMEWLGWMFFRFTSPGGMVVLTSPYVTNADSPITLDEVGRVDLILVPNGHGDDMGEAFEIALQTGARVVAPDPLGRWFVSRGLPAGQVIATSVGNVHEVGGIHVRVVHNLHDNNVIVRGAHLDVPYGGPAQGYIVTFENGFTMYFAASSALHMDMQLYGSLYRPHLALLNLGTNRDPADLAQMARLLLTDNPNLQTVVPQHHRVGAGSAPRAAAEIQRLGLLVRFLSPEILAPYVFGAGG
jgi:L-ascorbate metabolism protein UlaG (beta-lactamase superfamily)